MNGEDMTFDIVLVKNKYTLFRIIQWISALNSLNIHIYVFYWILYLIKATH